MPAPPIVTGAHQSTSRWREGNKLAQIAGKRHRKHKKPPVGTTFSFVLNEQATVTFSFTQRVSGRKVGRNCVAETRKNRKRKTCKRTVTPGTLLNWRAGPNKVVFQGRISHHKKLKPGHYTLVITATNAAGQKSAGQKLTFTIVK